MGKTFKDRRKFDRKHERNDGIKEVKREPKRQRHVDEDEPLDLYSEYDED